MLTVLISAPYAGSMQSQKQSYCTVLLIDHKLPKQPFSILKTVEKTEEGLSLHLPHVLFLKYGGAGWSLTKKVPK
ncbi:MAG: hypothetical protein GY810_17580 [Aureispira sp.]|nr:hypothetical protein [Aureispira sp.]